MTVASTIVHFNRDPFDSLFVQLDRALRGWLAKGVRDDQVAAAFRVARDENVTPKGFVLFVSKTLRSLVERDNRAAAASGVVPPSSPQKPPIPVRYFNPADHDD